MNRENVVKLTSKLLGMAGDKFINHGCNDLDDDFWEGISEEEKQALYKGFHEWNGDPDDYDPSQTDYLGDASLMRYFADKVKEI